MWSDPFLDDLLYVHLLIQVNGPFDMILCELDLEELCCWSIISDLPFLNDLPFDLVNLVSRTGPTVGNDDEGEIERRGDYQTSEGADERVD